MTSVAKYAWDEEGGVLYSNLFTAGLLDLPQVQIQVETAYPFGDVVKYTVKTGKTRIGIHIPAFTVKNYSVSVPGEYRDGYYYLDVKAGDVVEVKLEMVPKLNRANPKVAKDSGLGAVTVGPVVYCAEGADNGGEVFSFTVDRNGLSLNKEIPAQIGGFKPVADSLGQVYTVTAMGTSLVASDPDALYFTEEYREEKRELKLIPYFMWGNRGENQMRVWLPVK